jgi:DNA-binding CsgD family transcriptional regulator
MSMHFAVFALYIAAPMLALAGIVLAFRLRRLRGEPFLSHYLAFLALSGLWGLALWTFPGLLRFLVASHAPPFALSPVILASKWIGFPFHLLQLYFLILTLAGILGRPVSKTFKMIYISVSISLAAALFIGLGLRLQGSSRPLFSLLHEWTTNLYLAFQGGVYVWGLAGASQQTDRGIRRTAAAFSGLYLASFGAYFLLTEFSIVNAPWGGILFSAVHAPVLAYLYLDRRVVSPPPAPAPAGPAFNSFCDRFELSSRERDIVRRLLEGQPNRQMEKELFLSLQTVKNYVSRIYKKLGVRNRLELMALFRNSAS